MTPELIELSKQAAEVLGVTAWDYISDYAAYNDDKTWLAEDSGRCADIALDRAFDTIILPSRVFVIADDLRIEVPIIKHNGDRNAAWRVAVLKAVIEQEKKRYE